MILQNIAPKVCKIYLHEENRVHQVAGKTDIGCKRSNNEDAFGISRIEQGLLAVVCDGMGGHHGGEVASELAVNCFLTEVPRLLQQGEPLQYALSGAGNVAHCAIRQRATENPELDKMGTTLVAVLLQGCDLFVTHAGDSRCYLHDGKNLVQLTRDDSVIQQMLDAGLSEADIVNSPFKNLLSNSLNAVQEMVKFSFNQFQVEWGNRLLLCSDGLTNSISFEAIDVIMANRHMTVNQCAEQLIAKSLANNASDNITVIVIEVGGN
jgi:serine/threonine protein phosphatase PrpC